MVTTIIIELFRLEKSLIICPKPQILPSKKPGAPDVSLKKGPQPQTVAGKQSWKLNTQEKGKSLGVQLQWSQTEIRGPGL